MNPRAWGGPVELKLEANATGRGPELEIYGTWFDRPLKDAENAGLVTLRESLTRQGFTWDEVRVFKDTCIQCSIHRAFPVSRFRDLLADYRGFRLFYAQELIDELVARLESVLVEAKVDLHRGALRREVRFLGWSIVLSTNFKFLESVANRREIFRTHGVYAFARHPDFVTPDTFFDEWWLAKGGSKMALNLELCEYPAELLEPGEEFRLVREDYRQAHVGAPIGEREVWIGP